MPFSSWPAADQAAWDAALTSRGLLDETAGAAAKWRVSSRNGALGAYSRWLDHLSSRSPQTLGQGIASRPTPDSMKNYIGRLQHLSSGGLLNEVKHLYDAIRVMAPDKDWRWLKSLVSRLNQQMKPRPKRDRMVDAWRVLEEAMRLMDEAPRVFAKDSWAERLQYRDGLILALLITRPLRRRNLAMIRIDHHLLRNGNGYALSFTDEETKNHQALELSLPGFLVPYMQRFLTDVRPRFPSAWQHDGLWPSRKRKSMTPGAIYEQVRKRTRKAFGAPINLHLFRDIAVTAFADESPEHMLEAPGLLGDRSFSIIERHYNQARSAEAVQQYGCIIAVLKEGLRPTSRSKTRMPSRTSTIRQVT